MRTRVPMHVPLGPCLQLHPRPSLVLYPMRCLRGEGAGGAPAALPHKEAGGTPFRSSLPLATRQGRRDCGLVPTEVQHAHVPQVLGSELPRRRGRSKDGGGLRGAHRTLCPRRTCAVRMFGPAPGLWGRSSAPDTIPLPVLDTPWDTRLPWGEAWIGVFLCSQHNIGRRAARRASIPPPPVKEEDWQRDNGRLAGQGQG